MFIIPDSDEAAHPNPQSAFFATDLECLIRAIQGVASIRTGCTVSVQSPAALGVTVAAGTALINGVTVVVAGGNLLIDPVDTDPRVDLITVDASGVIAVEKGVPALVGASQGPKPPDIPANEAPLAYVLVLAGATKITANEIVDKRVIVLNGLSLDALKGTVGTPSNINRFVTGMDPRLWNARRPRLHEYRHQAGGGDDLEVSGLHGRVAQPQAPDHHARVHQAGGSDQIRLDDVAAPDDTTDLDVSTARQGLMPRGTNAEQVYKSNATVGYMTTLRCDQSANGRAVSPVGVDKWA